MKSNCIIYQIDKDDLVIHISDAWQVFADQNEARDLTAQSILNNDLFDFISDAECQHLYGMLLERVRGDNQTVDFPFRCDAPARRRFMSMRISPLGEGGVEFNSCVVREEAREPVLLLDKNTPRTDEVLTICSWCKKVNTENDTWLEVEGAIVQLGLFSAKVLPLLSHGMCMPCLDRIRSEWE